MSDMKDEGYDEANVVSEKLELVSSAAWWIVLQWQLWDICEECVWDGESNDSKSFDDDFLALYNEHFFERRADLRDGDEYLWARSDELEHESELELDIESNENVFCKESVELDGMEWTQVMDTAGVASEKDGGMTRSQFSLLQSRVSQ